MTAALSIFFVLALAGVPIALVMIASGLAGAVTIGGMDYLEIIADRFYAGVAGFVLIAVPYFIFPVRTSTSASACFSPASPAPP